MNMDKKDQFKMTVKRLWLDGGSGGRSPPEKFPFPPRLIFDSAEFKFNRKITAPLNFDGADLKFYCKNRRPVDF